MPKGGLLTIRATRVAAEGGDETVPTICIAVGDEGEGMTQPVLDRIFEPFFATKGDGRGTGLGLPSVKRIVDQLGGTIEVESAIGAGTTFRLYLPAVNEPKVRPEALGEKATHATETVLVVDDDDDVRDAVVLALESGGYTVLRATDGTEAHPNLPIIVVSGYSSSENADLPPEVLFVPKPFSTKMLLACVRQALDDR